MIQYFDSTNINDFFQYTYTNTDYTNNLPISGIYKCFLFCGYLINSIPIHQLVGQYDDNIFFINHEL